MPELAEVELARRQWAAFHGQPITHIQSHPKARIYRDCPASALRILTDLPLVSSRTHGKRLLFTFQPTLHLELHLGMSGRLLVLPPDHTPTKHDHLLLHTPPATLAFNDYRMFGRLFLHDSLDPFALFPPPPHDPKFSLAHVTRLCQKHPKKPLKALLLDQSACPGIGNWMADEIAWRLRLHPATPIAQISPAALRKETRFVTLGALRHVADQNENASAAASAPGHYVPHVPPATWLFQHRWKKGGTCPRCRSPLSRDTIATRTTAWCPTCQKI